MKRLDLYLLGEMLLPFVSGVLLIIVMLVGNTLFPLIEPIVKNGIPVMVVAKLVAFNIPTLLVLTLPAGMALSAAWAVNRMARDSEVTAIRMAGVPLRRLFLPIFVMGVAASLLAFWVGDRVVPPANREFQQTQTQMGAYALQALPDVAADKVFTFQDYSFHIHEIRKDPGGDVNKLHLAGVTIFKNPENGVGFPTLITAQSATYDHDVWTFHGVMTHIFDANGVRDLRTVGKPGHAEPARAAGQPGAERDADAGDADDAAVGDGDAGAGEHGAARDGRLQRRRRELLHEAVAAVHLPGVRPVRPAADPALRPPGRVHGHLPLILMVWVAWNTLLLGKFLGLSGKLSPVLAAWAPDALFMALGLLLLWRME